MLGVFHENIEVTIFVEGTRIQQLVFHIATIALSVLLNQIAIRKSCLGILVQVLHVRVRGGAVEVEVVFFYVFAVVGLAVRQPEHAFLEDGVLTIPQGHAETEQLFVVADTCKTVLAPVIGPRPSLVMSEIIPRISVLTIILANSAPLPLAKIRTPLSPRGFG